MKVVKYIILVLVLLLIGLLVYGFFFVSGMKSQPEWYAEPDYNPDTLYEAVYRRAGSNLENGYSDSRPGETFKVVVDLRTLECYMMLYEQEALEEYGIERPRTEMISEDTVRVYTRVLKGPLSGAVLHVNIKMSLTEDGNLALEPGKIMAGNKELPGFVISQVEKALGQELDRYVVTGEDLGYDVKLVKFDMTPDQVTFTCRKSK
ncbi:MAG: hypothetical protein U5N86_09745 [Planctomycetota bacterium]|nr:hypothetical protein [Planctomycetota bacterium]